MKSVEEIRKSLQPDSSLPKEFRIFQTKKLINRPDELLLNESIECESWDYGSSNYHMKLPSVEGFSEFMMRYAGTLQRLIKALHTERNVPLPNHKIVLC
jgi:hypothetical protein